MSRGSDVLSALQAHSPEGTERDALTRATRHGVVFHIGEHSKRTDIKSTCAQVHPQLRMQTLQTRRLACAQPRERSWGQAKTKISARADFTHTHNKLQHDTSPLPKCTTVKRKLTKIALIYLEWNQFRSTL